MYALLSLLFFIPLFSLDCGFAVSTMGYGDLKTVSVKQSSEQKCFKPSSSASTSSLSHFSVEINNFNSPSKVRNYAYMFPQITAMYNNGQKDELVKHYNSIGVVELLRNPEARLMSEYLGVLLREDNAELLSYLSEMARIDTPRRMRVLLDKIYSKTKKPSSRAIALVLADKKTGGGNFILNSYLPKKEHIPADGNPGLFVGRDFHAELRRDAPYAQEVIDVELAKYAVERYLPELWAPFTSEIAYQYLQNVIYISERVPSYHQKEVIDWAMLGFYSRLTDPKATMKSHKDAVWNVSEKLATAVIKASAGNLKCVPDSIAMLHDDIHWLINDCPRQEVQFKAGQRLADAAYFVAYGTALRAAMSGVEVIDAVGICGGVTQKFSISANTASSVASSASSISSAEELARGMVQILAEQNNCIMTKKTSDLEHWVCKLEEGQNATDVFKKIDGLGPVREIPVTDKTPVLVRSIDGKIDASCRDFSKSFGNEAATIEFPLKEYSIKMRYAGTLEAFQKMLSKGKLKITK